MSNLTQAIAAILANAGPVIQAEPVHFGDEKLADGAPNPSYRDLGVFNFRRLSFYEVDKLRLESVGAFGVFDPAKHAGNNGRFIAATLVDENGNASVTKEEVYLWPTWMVSAFFDAAQRANSVQANADTVIAKNSEASQTEQSS